MFLRQSYRSVTCPSSRGAASLRRLSTAAVTATGTTGTTRRTRTAPAAAAQTGLFRPRAHNVLASSASPRVLRQPPQARHLHASRRMQAVKSVLFTDIGEGIVECEVIQWFVQPGARVEEFAPLCEVQSDKATVEVTSRYAGVVKKLHHEAGEMVRVGKPFIDIDIPDDVAGADADAGGSEQQQQPPPPPAPAPPAEATSAEEEPSAATPPPPSPHQAPQGKKFSGSSLATPAVRHLCKELDVDITQVDGTGKDGRVLKEDLHRFVAERKRAAAGGSDAPVGSGSSQLDAPQQETAVPLAGTQLQMFKSMTRSLAIPHFLYADEVDFTQLHGLRQRLNAALAAGRLPQPAAAATDPAADPAAAAAAVTKLSYLPFVIKAVSLALHQYPVLNARVDAGPSPAEKPRLVYRSQHNVGVAMDTPAGLVVPVVRNVQARSVLAIAGELARLQALAQAGRLAPADLQGGTITVSNIGNIGGSYLSPVVVDREVAILAMGRMRTVPAFAEEAGGSGGGDGSSSPRIVKRHVCHFSFSADHRVVDGATLARAAEVVRQMVEQPAMMAVQLR